MSFRVNDQMTASVFINNSEVLLDYGNALQTVHIRAATQLYLPTAQLVIVDTLNQMPKYGLQDGVQVQVVFQGAIKVSRLFRVAHWDRFPLAQGFKYVIDLYCDSPKYWIGTSRAGIRGTSSAVLQNIASQCGLQWWSGSTSTSDSMLWMQGNRRFCSFAKAIAGAGYAGPTSHMILAVDSTGFMRYIDVNANPSPKVTVGYTPPQNGGSAFVMMTDFRPVANSGVANMMGGYKHDRYVQGIDGDDGSTSETDISFTPDAQYPLLSSDVRGKIGSGLISFAPVDFGNVHPDYERARYQNMRYNLLNSLLGEFVFPTQTSFEPGDNFSYAATADLNSTQYNGEYTVKEKIVFMQGGSYNEKIVAIKNGLSK